MDDCTIVGQQSRRQRRAWGRAVAPRRVNGDSGPLAPLCGLASRSDHRQPDTWSLQSAVRRTVWSGRGEPPSLVWKHAAEREHTVTSRRSAWGFVSDFGGVLLREHRAAQLHGRISWRSIDDKTCTLRVALSIYRDLHCGTWRVGWEELISSLYFWPFPQHFSGTQMDKEALMT